MTLMGRPKLHFVEIGLNSIGKTHQLCLMILLPIPTSRRIVMSLYCVYICFTAVYIYCYLFIKVL